GMTEMSPLGTGNQLKAKHLNLSEEEQYKVRLSQGRPPFGVDLRITDEENGTHEVARDGPSTGNLQVKGHWIIESYYGKSEKALSADG
ncbi:long-chain fatty acid--CoA ligase, partial [Acinetobacter sp. ULE_I053]